MTEQMDAPYSNREIREKWHDTANTLQEIKNQTTKTNGSVADINKWRERINGMAIASGIFMSLIVVPILAWSLYILVNINQTVHSSIDQALQAYNIQVK